MSHIILSYTKFTVPAQDDSPEKVIFCPILEAFLFNQDRQTNFAFRCIVDSGADFCVFPAKFGELIGLKVKEGPSIASFGVGGKEILYFQDISVGVLINKQIWKFKCSAGFSFKMNPKGVGLLGRRGFFDLFSEIAFNQNKRMFRLSGEAV